MTLPAHISKPPPLHTYSFRGNHSFLQITQLSRRSFLKGTLASLLALASSKQAFLPFTVAPATVSLESLQQADFEALQGESFQLRHNNRTLGMVQLDIVKDRSQSANHRSSEACKCLSLAFRAPKDLLLGQETYTFVHPRLGLFDLFIVPAAPTEDEQRYTAVINRI